MAATSATSTAIPAPGFADPTGDAQRAFRAVLDALAHPGRPYPLAGPATPPAALGNGLAAVLLTVLDEDTTVHLGPALAADDEVGPWLAFHTGVRTAPVEAAAFVVVTPAELPDLAGLAQGTEESPHTSATVVLDVRGVDREHRVTGTGPGIDGSIAIDLWTASRPDADATFAEQWARNGRRFPRGVDLLLVDDHQLTALPRTTRLAPTGTES